MRRMQHLPIGIGLVPSSSKTRAVTRACHKQQESGEEEIDAVMRYHEATKHSLTEYARGPRGLDWANQPNPFRRYTEAELVRLSAPDHQQDRPYPIIFDPHQHISVEPISKSTLSHLFYDSLALSAWKTTGASTWSLRVNPSSGNLHPTEGYVICGAVEGICDKPFVAHYAPREHALEIRTHLPLVTWEQLSAPFPRGSFFIALSSIFWREAWKYGERAFRYCNHDVGHAIGAVAIAAANLGWRTQIVDSWGYQDLHVLMGLTRVKIVAETARGRFPQLEEEHADCVMVLFPCENSTVMPSWCPSKELILQLSELTWRGKPNRLSSEHIRWDIIYTAADAAKKPTSIQAEVRNDPPVLIGFDQYLSVYKDAMLRHIVRTRRSAVSMDSQYTMGRDAFYQIMLKAMPTRKQLPFSALPWSAEVVSLVLFVHRVADLPQGLYLLVRNPMREEDLKMALRPEFQWEKPAGCPSVLPLYLLARGDCRFVAERLSCHQDIASDGCFSLGMLARFEDCMRDHGAWMYPRLFWEAGALGQLLYLEAHAVGVSATGIGCYFDDAVHQLLGIKDTKFQSVYHFAIGAAVLDKRIMSLPSYPGPLGEDF